MRIFVSNLGYSFIGHPNTIIGANIRHDLAFEVYKAISLIMASFDDCLLSKEHLLFSVQQWMFYEYLLHTCNELHEYNY